MNVWLNVPASDQYLSTDDPTVGLSEASSASTLSLTVFVLLSTNVIRTAASRSGSETAANMRLYVLSMLPAGTTTSSRRMVWSSPDSTVWLPVAPAFALSKNVTSTSTVCDAKSALRAPNVMPWTVAPSVAAAGPK